MLSDAMTETLRIRTEMWRHIVFGLFVTVPMVALTIFLIVTEPRQWPPMLVFLALAGYWHLYYRSLLVTVSNGVLTYRTIFAARSIPLAAILSARVSEGRPGRLRGGRFISVFPPWLVIHYAPDQELAFNLKPFRLADIRQLLAMPEFKLSPDAKAFWGSIPSSTVESR